MRCCARACGRRLFGAFGRTGTKTRIIAGRVIGAAGAEKLAAKAQCWIDAHLGADYAWPGNMRELEQCVRDIFAQGEYVPEDMPGPGAGQIADVSGEDEPDLTADEVVQRQCAAVYAKTGNYQETARRLGLDRRTVRVKTEAWNRRAAADSPAAGRRR